MVHYCGRGCSCRFIKVRFLFPLETHLSHPTQGARAKTAQTGELNNQRFFPTVQEAGRPSSSRWQSRAGDSSPRGHSSEFSSSPKCDTVPRKQGAPALTPEFVAHRIQTDSRDLLILLQRSCRQNARLSVLRILTVCSPWLVHCQDPSLISRHRWLAPRRGARADTCSGH